MRKAENEEEEVSRFIWKCELCTIEWPTRGILRRKDSSTLKSQWVANNKSNQACSFLWATV